MVKALYDNLPDKTRILTNKCVKGIVETESGVVVEIQDGTSYEGDIVLGCDGVNSVVRDIMWDKANLAVPGYITATEKKCKFLPFLFLH